MISGERKTNILIVDDHPVVRYGLSGVLNAEPDFDVVGDSANCTECCEKIKILSPDLVVLDLEMSDSFGSDAIRKLRTLYPDIKTVVYTAFNNDWRVTEVIKIGVQGYVVKNSDSSILIHAIRLVSQGDYFLDPAVTSKVMLHVRDLEKRHQKKCVITEREKDVLKLISKGYRNKEIARSLIVVESTIKYHVSSIFTKLSVSSRINAVRVAKEQGILHEQTS